MKRESSSEFQFDSINDCDEIQMNNSPSKQWKSNKLWDLNNITILQILT